MDIAQLSMNMAESKLMQSASILVMKKALEMTEQNGAELAEMIQSIPATEGSIDIQA